MNDNKKACAILSYLVIGIVWFFIDKTLRDDEFAKFHAKQGMVLTAISILNSMVHIIFITKFISIGLFVLMIIGISNAWQMKKDYLPVV